MNPKLSQLLYAASSQVVEAVAARISENVVNCREMSYTASQSGKTNPLKLGKPNPRNTGPRRLSPRQLVAAQMLVDGETACSVARHLGMDPRTIFRWKNDSRFTAEIERLLTQQRQGGAQPNPAKAKNAPDRKQFAADDDEDSEDPNPENWSEQERRDMEQLFAISGDLPFWKRGIAYLPPPETS